jgi:FkbM family methyltransferase
MEIQEWENWLKPEIQGNVDLVKSYLKTGDVFVDVGANSGLFTKMILDDLGYSYLDKVLLFEPVPYLATECRRKFNLYENIEVYQLALSDLNCKTTILASKQNLGYNKIYKEGMEIHSHDRHDIECKTFSSWAFVEKVSKVDFVKIDAEGHDVNVVYGMFDWISQTGLRPYILFEINWYKGLENGLISDMKRLFNYNFTNYGRDVLLTP